MLGPARNSALREGSPSKCELRAVHPQEAAPTTPRAEKSPDEANLPFLARVAVNWPNLRRQISTPRPLLGSTKRS